MNITITKNSENNLMRLRRLGYAPYTNRQGKSSFVKRIQGAEFPRLHLYINKESADSLTCSMHIDQAAPVYSKGNAHRGDYDSPALDLEAARIEKTNR